MDKKYTLELEDQEATTLLVVLQQCRAECRRFAKMNQTNQGYWLGEIAKLDRLIEKLGNSAFLKRVA